MKSYRLLVGALLVAAACSSSSSPPAGSNPVDGSSGADVAVGNDDGPDPDTWSNWAGGFFIKYCDECHSVNDPSGLDFGVQSTVVANKSTIRCGACAMQDPSWGCPASPPAKQFPISDMAGTNPKPSDAERDRLVAWIGAGCP